MRKHGKEVVWIAAATLLLCLVSAYRQISLRYFPGDIARPVVVYFVYLLLLTGWWGAIRSRITQRNMRIFLLAQYAIMLFGMTSRFIQDALLYRDIYLMRVSGYLIIVPMILLPLIGLYAAFGLGKSEEYRINSKWYILLIPAGIFTALALTNESHQFIFRQIEGEVQPNLYFHPNTGVYILVAWGAILEISRFFLIFRRSRELEGSIYKKSVPFLVALGIVLFNFPYLIDSFVVQFELIEYTALMFFLEAMVWESCISIGMVPVNTHYEEVFDRSTASMQIVDNAGQPYLQSTCAPELSQEDFALLKWQHSTRKPDGQELHLHAIQGGYVVWQNDVSRTAAVIEELQTTAERLEQESELLRQEVKVRSDEAAVREQNRIYNQLTEEVGAQLALLRDLLKEQEQAADKAALFKKICLIGAYIKRRCNLRLVEQSDGSIPNQELELCYYDLTSCLQQMGVAADVLWNTKKTLAPEFAIFTLDVFELLLEQEHFTPQAVLVTFETDTAFSIQVQSRRMPTVEMNRMNKENYAMDWQTMENGYQVSVCDEGA